MGDDPTSPAQTAPADPPFPLTDVDKWVLSLTDEEFKYHDWDDMKKIIAENNLSVLKRKPSDLRKYMKWTAEMKAQYGSITNYLMACRLPKAWGTPPFKPASNIPFEDPSDYRVLLNDWPYGMTPNMTHIVVWSRTPIETDNEKGDLTPESQQIVSDFVRRFFVERLGPQGSDKVLWFKNWVALQSVRALEHIHVIVRDVEKDILDEWTKELDCHRL
ncbi:hypothetical protein DL765_004474 [Monosporascus sp. GIB2]|nr:hypothetical protein DL765_004474 [Monosporascus sp. GIB2]